MFTGIIVERGKVVSMVRQGDFAKLTVRAETARTSRTGDSISVNGVCLTVTGIKEDTMTFDLSHETLRVTNLGRLTINGYVNIEPALKISDGLSGHIVTGHVDCMGVIKAKRNRGKVLQFDIMAPREFMVYLIPKGSVTVDGISLTVVDIKEDVFSVVIIPHTLMVTTMGLKKEGDYVNLEGDIIGKYVLKYLESLNFGRRPHVSADYSD